MNIPAGTHQTFLYTYLNARRHTDASDEGVMQDVTWGLYPGLGPVGKEGGVGGDLTEVDCLGSHLFLNSKYSPKEHRGTPARAV